MCADACCTESEKATPFRETYRAYIPVVSPINLFVRNDTAPLARSTVPAGSDPLPRSELHHPFGPATAVHCTTRSDPLPRSTAPPGSDPLPRSELPIPRVAEAGDDIGIRVEAVVDARGVHGCREATGLDPSDAFGSSQRTNDHNVLRAA
jgi:hypothetical protein